MDVSLFRWINGWPDSLNPLFHFFSEATKETPGRIVLGLLVIGMLAHPKTRGTTAIALLAVGLANLTTDVVKAAFQAQRPCVELSDVHLRVGKLTSFGTASAHSANMAAIATVFTRRFKWWGMPWILAALMTGLSRIYVGVHYPYQVLFGFGVGVFSAYLLMECLGAYERIRNQEPPEAPADRG
jgi:undecaprenyl-diphosphatase